MVTSSINVQEITKGSFELKITKLVISTNTQAKNKFSFELTTTN